MKYLPKDHQFALYHNLVNLHDDTNTAALWVNFSFDGSQRSNPVSFIICKTMTEVDTVLRGQNLLKDIYRLIFDNASRDEFRDKQFNNCNAQRRHCFS
jgi:hypothetical protein